MSPLRIIIDETDFAAFSDGMPNKFVRLATLLGRVFPDAENGFVGEDGFRRRELDLHASKIDRLWYLSLEPLTIGNNPFRKAAYRIKLALLAQALRLPLPPDLVYKIRWAGAYNLNVALDLLTSVEKSKFYEAFDIGANIRINLAFKGWLRNRRRRSLSQANIESYGTSILGKNDLVILTGLTKGTETRLGLLRGKQRFGFKTVLILLDCGPLEYPSITSVRDYELARSNFSVLARLADVFVVPSEHARGVICSACEAMRILQPKIAIVRPPLGLSPGGARANVPQIQRIVADKKRFALTILALKPRKDFCWLLAVWQHALSMLGALLPHLVVVLSYNADAEYFDSDLVSPSLADHVRIVDQPTDAELAWLYANASFVVHPPSFGGFGTTLIEAAAFGKPCLCERSEAYEDFSHTGHVIQLDRDLNSWAKAISAFVLQPDDSRIAPIDLSDLVSLFTKQIRNVITSIEREGVSKD